MSGASLSDIELYVTASNIPSATKSHKKPDVFLTLTIVSSSAGAPAVHSKKLKTIKKFDTNDPQWPQPFHLGANKSALGSLMVEVFDAHITLQSDTIVASGTLTIGDVVEKFTERGATLANGGDSTSDVDAVGQLFEKLQDPVSISLPLTVVDGVPVPEVNQPPTVTFVFKPVYVLSKRRLSKNQTNEHFTKIINEEDKPSPDDESSSPVEPVIVGDQSNAGADRETPGTNSLQERAPTLSAPPLNGIYRIRTFHGTYVSAQPNKPFAEAAPTSALGNFERFEVRGPTEEEIKRLAAFRDEHQKGNSKLWEKISSAEYNASITSNYSYSGQSWTRSDKIENQTSEGDEIIVGDSVTNAGANKSEGNSTSRKTSLAFTTASSVPSFVVHEKAGSEDKSAELYPMVVIRSVPLGTYLCLSDSNQLRLAPIASAWEIFTLRPHPRLRPVGKYWLLRSEYFQTNVAAVSTKNGAHPSHDFNAIQTASEWCGFEFIPAQDSYTRHTFAQQSEDEGGAFHDGKIASSLSFLSKPGLPPTPAAAGTYVITARSANARLAVTASGPAAIPANTEPPLPHATTIRLVPMPKEHCGGKTSGCFALQGAATGTFIGLEKKRLYAGGQAFGWEAWEVLPHPTEPLHHSIKSVAFGKYLSVEPTQGGVGLRVADKPGPWEAFYLGDVPI